MNLPNSIISNCGMFMLEEGKCFWVHVWNNGEFNETKV